MAELKIFLGYASGVGKTTAMLDEALSKVNKQKDIIVGWINTHDDIELKQRSEAFYSIAPIVIDQRYTFDLDTALQRHPDLILLDDIAHVNAPGSRHQTRLQDVEELLQAGISVYTTLNIQDVESVQDLVYEITKLKNPKPISDTVFELAAQVQLIDIDVDELMERTRYHKIYSNLLSKTQLTLLRELALRKTTERIQYKDAKHALDRVAVFISLKTGGEKSIRWGARQAQALSIPLVVLFWYDSTHEFTPIQQRTIKRLQTYTASVDGDFIALPSSNLVESLCECLEEEHISQLVFTASRGFERLYQFYLMNRLMQRLPSVEFLFVPEQEGEIHISKRQSSRRPFAIKEWLRTFAVIIVTIAFAFLFKWIDVGEMNSILVFLIGIIIIARFTSSYRYSIVASFLNVIIITFFFIEPYYSFTISFQKYPLFFIIMLLLAFMMSTLNMRSRKEMQRALDREKKTNTLYRLNQGLLEHPSIDDALLFVAETIHYLFNQSVLIDYTTHPALTKSVFHDPSDQTLFSTQAVMEARNWVLKNGKPAGYGTPTFSQLPVYLSPILSDEHPLGVICVSGRYPRLENDDFNFLRIIVAQLAIVLERSQMVRQQQSFLMESQRETLRSDLLRSISHDLRTPLTSIYGSSSALLNNQAMDENTRVTLLTNIQEDAQWLIRMIENILTITKFNDGRQTIEKRDEMVEEVVGEAVGRMTQRFARRNIIVEIPDEVLFVKMDGLLIEQVIINLIENAIRHSLPETNITLKVWLDNNFVFFMVEDEGEGIAEDRLATLFDQNKQPHTGDLSRGLGIGLSLCMTIIKAHGGWMSAENREDITGARFTFTLPR